jgi:hypothetical protein
MAHIIQGIEAQAIRSAIGLYPDEIAEFVEAEFTARGMVVELR